MVSVSPVASLADYHGSAVIRQDRSSPVAATARAAGSDRAAEPVFADTTRNRAAWETTRAHANTFVTTQLIRDGNEVPGAADGSEAVEDAILDKGLAEWAREQQMERLRKKIEAEIMAELGLSGDDLKKMEPEARTRLMSAIQEEVERRIREAMQAKMAEKLGDAAAMQAGSTAPLSRALSQFGVQLQGS